jgi:hypothetical protein
MRASPLLVLLLAAGCFIDERSGDGADDPPGRPSDRSAPIVPVRQGCIEEPGVFVRSASIVDSYVTIIAEHGGGCGEHRYEVCWDGLFGISDPPTVELTVRDRTDDTCDGLVWQPVLIDLAALRAGSDDGGALQIAFPGGARVLYR